MKPTTNELEATFKRIQRKRRQLHRLLVRCARLGWCAKPQTKKKK